MKKIQLTLFLVFFCIIANAQYLKMPLDTNHCWSQSWYSSHTNGTISEYCNGTYQLKVRKDTLINGTIYQALKKTTITSYSSNGPCYDPNYYTEKYVRQDTLLKIVIILDANQEKILYNFNKNVGDTAKLFIGFAVRTMTLQSKDSILLNDGIYHKRFNFSDGSGYYGGDEIEGVGSLTGLVTPCFVGYENADYLVCMAKINPTIQTIYHQAGNSYSCSIVTSIEPNDLLPSIFAISPNPSSSILTIQTEEDIAQITIYNIIGEACIYKPLGYKSVDVSNLPNGVYYLELKTTKGLVRKKFVKE